MLVFLPIVADAKIIFRYNFVAPLMANVVVQYIMDNIKSGGSSYYSIIPDEYTDASNLEQLTMCFRWRDNDLHVNEIFLVSIKHLMFQQRQ